MIFSADFETTTTEPTSVWIWGLSEVGNPDNFIHGSTIDELLQYCKISGNHTLYFFNLKFDGNFILHHLLSNNYKWVKDKKDTTNNSFTTIISDDGKFYCFTIYFRKDSYSKHVQKVTIYDAMKLFPGFSVKQIANSFNLPIKKGEIDYDRHNKDCEITQNEIDYLKNDCQIVAMALYEMFKLGLNKMTIGSCALKEYKQLIGKNFKKMFPPLTLEDDAKIRMSYRGGFTYANPQYTGKNVGQGIVLDVNSLYPSVMYNELMPYGVPIAFEGKYKTNKAYPLYVQKLRCAFKLKKNHIPTIQLKHNPQFIATEYLTDSGMEMPELCLTNIDLKLFFKHYDVYCIEYMGGYMFKGSNNLFKSYIDKWTDIKINAGKLGNSGLRTIAKLMLNNLYGKFALNPHIRSKKPYLSPENIVKYETLPEELREPIYIPVGTFITAYARYKTISTSQKIHEKSIKETGKSRYLYSDTDSIHMLGTDIPKYIDIDDFKLGAWAHESTFYKARFLRTKRYIEYNILLNDNLYVSENETEKEKLKKAKFMRTKKGIIYNPYNKPNEIKPFIVNKFNNKLYVFQQDSTGFPPSVTCAGMPDKCYKYVTWHNFKQGTQFEGKLRPKTVEGGVILMPELFTMNL